MDHYECINHDTYQLLLNLSATKPSWSTTMSINWETTDTASINSLKWFRQEDRGNEGQTNRALFWNREKSKAIKVMSKTTIVEHKELTWLINCGWSWSVWGAWVTMETALGRVGELRPANRFPPMQVYSPFHKAGHFSLHIGTFNILHL